MPRKPLPMLAHVVGTTLSDQSKVYNVTIPKDPQLDVGHTVTIGAFSKAHAEEIAAALNHGAAWLEVS